jgi:hypothetical protein
MPTDVNPKAAPNYKFILGSAACVVPEGLYEGSQA